MDEEAEIDELFGKLAADKANEVNALLRIGNMRGTAPDAHVFRGGSGGVLDEADRRAPGMLRPSDALRLFDVVTLARWAKVPADRLAFARGDMSVYTAELYADATLCQPRAKRRVLTPHTVMVHHEQSGCFECLLEIEAFQVPGTGEQYLLCTTLNRRLDVESILTGGYVFCLVDGGTRTYAGMAVHERSASAPGVLRIAIDGFAILRERAVLVNFFYEYLPWRADMPLPDKKYK